MAPGGNAMAKIFMPNIIKIKQRQSEAQRARRSGCATYDEPPDYGEWDHSLPLWQRPEDEVRGDDCPLHGRTRRRVPHSRGDFADYAGPERVPYNRLRRFEPERHPWNDLYGPEPGPPFDRQPLRGRSGFYNQDDEPRHHNRRGRLAQSSDPWNHRFSSLSLDYYPENDKTLEDDLSLGPHSYDRQRPGIYHDHPSGPYRNDYRRSPAHSQDSWDSAARHGGRGGISRVYGPMSPNRDRTGQYSLHGSSSDASSDLTTWTHI